MKKFLSASAVVLTLLVPAASFAATYQYVSTDGTLKSVTANSAAEALALPTDLAPHSGVILDLDSSSMIPSTGTMMTGSSSMMTSSSSTMTSDMGMSSLTMMTSTSSMMTSSSSMMMDSTASSTMMTSSSSMMTSSST